MPSPGPHSDPSSVEAIVREQIELLWRYQEERRRLDPEFLMSHARTIVQLAHLMKHPSREESSRSATSAT